MLHPEQNPDALYLAKDYVITSAKASGGEFVNNSSIDVNALALKAAATIIEKRESLRRDEQGADAFFGQFIPAVFAARAAAHDIALTQGEFTPTDDESLANAGSGLENMKDYLVPFVLRKEAELPEDVPPIGIGAILRMKGAGHEKDGYVSVDTFSVVERTTDWPGFAKQFEVPVLFDAQTYTLEEFAALSSERADGYAAQVEDTWRSITETERDQPSFTGKPLVVRAVAVLPLLPEDSEDAFEVDFLPQISRTKQDEDAHIKRAYDVRLLVRGAANLGANYLKFDYGTTPQSVFADSNGRRAPLTVRRAEAVADTGAPTSLDDLSLTARSQGAIALFIAPHVIKERPLPLIPSDTGLNNVMFGGGATRGLGGASVGMGPASFIGSGKRSEGLFDRVAPELEGRPIIVSLQLLTHQ